jgi:hypothetical protein
MVRAIEIVGRFLGATLFVVIGIGWLLVWAHPTEAVVALFGNNIRWGFALSGIFHFGVAIVVLWPLRSLKKP